MYNLCVQKSRKSGSNLPFLESGNDMPFSILMMSGVAALLLKAVNTENKNDIEITSSTQSALATTILKSAYTYQQNASDKRLGVGPPKSATSSLGLNQFKNLSKARAIQDERKLKKAEVQLKGVGIKVIATIWMSDNLKNKLTKVSHRPRDMKIPTILHFHRLDKSRCLVSMRQLLA